MSITVLWDNPDKTVIRIAYGGVWTMAQAFVARDEADALASTVNHPIATIFDFSASQRIPNDFLSSFRMESNRPEHHKHLREVVFVSRGHLLKTLLETANKLYPGSLSENIQFTNTIEDARRHLSLKRQSFA